VPSGRPDDLGTTGVPLQEVGEPGGLPAQHDATRIWKLREHSVERRRAVTCDDRLGPGDHDGRHLLELQGGALHERGEVVHFAGENVNEALSEDLSTTGQTGDGVSAHLRRCCGGPLGGGGVVGAHDERARGSPRASPRGYGTQQFPEVPALRYGWRLHQHHRPAALERGLCISYRHTILDCQRANGRGWYVLGTGKATASVGARHALPLQRGCVPLAGRAILSPMSPPSGLSPNLQHLETSATIAISQEAKRRKAAGEDVIDLGAGEPDFPTPAIPSDAGVRAIREGKTHYPANEGILELRAAAAKHLSLLSGGRPVNADNIVVSNGSKQSLFNVCFTLFGPGDVVAIPAPAWVSYPQIVYLCRARPVLVPGDPEWSLKVSVRDLDRVVPGAKGLVLCSPCNPTGAVYTHA